MKILVDVGHPKDVNIFKNSIWNLERKGYEVKITTCDKENILAMLDYYGFDYELRKYYMGITKKIFGLLKNDFLLYNISKKFKPDVFVSLGDISIAHVSKLLGRPHIAFVDTEIANLNHRLMLPFTDVVCTSSSFNTDYGSKQIRYEGYLELAYLHPNHFKPDQSVLERLNLNKHDEFIILRFSLLKAHHDIGVKGFNFRDKIEVDTFIKKLENYGRVFITSEIGISKDLDRYKINIPIGDFHSFLSFATLYIGEGASMAAEAAVLGVPSVYVSTTRRGYLDELEEKYGLVFTITERKQALKKVEELLEDVDIKGKWKKKKEKMLSDKIDTTKFIVDFIENYVKNEGNEGAK